MFITALSALKGGKLTAEFKTELDRAIKPFQLLLYLCEDSN